MASGGNDQSEPTRTQPEHMQSSVNASLSTAANISRSNTTPSTATATPGSRELESSPALIPALAPSVYNPNMPIVPQTIGLGFSGGLNSSHIQTMHYQQSMLFPNYGLMPSYSITSPAEIKQQDESHDETPQPAPSSQSDDQHTPSEQHKSIQELRDELYREKRQKNNEAAKRSRDSRRQKAEAETQRVACLEQEHLTLLAQHDNYTKEVADLRMQLGMPLRK